MHTSPYLNGLGLWAESTGKGKDIFPKKKQRVRNSMGGGVGEYRADSGEKKKFATGLSLAKTLLQYGLSQNKEMTTCDIES